MGETATDNQVPAEQTGQTPVVPVVGAAQDIHAETLDVASVGGESPASVGTAQGETAREVAAQHFSRLMYTPVSTWSRYVFHENDPHPFGSTRHVRARG